MKNRLKFKIWNDVEKKFCESDEILLTIDGKATTGLETSFSDGKANVKLDFVDYEIVEFTGLLDKNGKEIYEGDILYVQPKDEQSGWCKEVYFENGSFRFNEWLLYDNFFMDNISVEIIGNIFENPELLNQ